MINLLSLVDSRWILKFLLDSISAILKFCNTSDVKQPIIFKGSNHHISHRMTSYMKKADSITQLYSIEPCIIYLRSKQILKILKQYQSIENKIQLFEEHNLKLHKIAQILYKEFNPNCIYCFNNEIHLVFYRSLDKDIDLPFNGNMNLFINYACSLCSVEFSKLYNTNIIFTGRLSIFPQGPLEYETLNFLIWRQLNCKRNILQLLFTSYTITSLMDENTNTTIKTLQHEDINGIKTLQMFNIIKSKYPQLEHKIQQLCNGILIKKELSYMITEPRNNFDSGTSSLVTYKSINKPLHLNFDSNMQMYIRNMKL